MQLSLLCTKHDSIDLIRIGDLGPLWSEDSLMRLRIITELAIDPNLAHTLNKFDRYAQSVKFPLLLGLGTILRSGPRKD
jgi:hypothetical protein